MKSFGDYVVRNKLVNNAIKVKELLVGKKLTVIGKISGHNYPDQIVVQSNATVGFYPVGHLYVGYLQNVALGNGSTIYFTEFTAPIPTKKADFEKELRDLEVKYQKERNELEEKLDLMEEYDLDEYDEDVLRINKALDTLESTKSRKDKVEALKELIR